MATTIEEAAVKIPARPSMFNAGKYSDLKIECNGWTFPVHRSVICAQSKVLERMVEGGFKEAATGVIDFPDDEPQSVFNMLKFLYTYNYDDCRDDGPNDAASNSTDNSTSNVSLIEPFSALVTNVKAYVIAEKNDIPAMKKLAKKKYEEIVPDGWNSVSFVESLDYILAMVPN